MKRKMLLSFLAMLPAMLVPASALSQLAKEKAPVDTSEPAYKWQAYAGVGYTSLNQLSQSESGLVGVGVSITRELGKYFGVTAEGGHYQWTVTATNPYPASVNLYLAGPEIHAQLYERTSLFFHGLIGAAHTGGVPIYPNYSFAGGVGVGLDYKLNSRLGIRAYGDDIGSSFSVTPYEPGDSPHRRFNAHAAMGVTYRF